MIKRTTLITIAPLLLAINVSCPAQQRDGTIQCSTEYEDSNQIDYGPLKISAVRGTTLIQIGNKQQPDVPGACFVLFTEKDHKVIANVRSSKDGRFEFQGITPGQYRLVARADGLCTANVSLEVVKSSQKQKTELLIHFIAVSLDTCSFAELVRARPKGHT